MKYKNHIKEYIKNGKFLYTLEYVPEILDKKDGAGISFLMDEARKLRTEPRIGGVNIGDRVKSMESIDTVSCGNIAAMASGKMPLLHLAGKDRDAAEGQAVFKKAFELGLDTFLLVSGDRVSQEMRPDRTRYFDSVNAIIKAKEINPTCFVAAAIAPFKYKEEELINQYLKMVKKIHAGADYLITNCGWDMDKLQELIWYRNARGFETPIVANLLVPALGWSRSIHARRLPGVYMSDDLFELIEKEHQESKENSKNIRAYRLALQIVGVKLMGYAGVHLSGVEKTNDLLEVISQADALESKYSTIETWWSAWRELHTFEDGRVVKFGLDNGLYLFGDKEPAKNSMDGPPQVESAIATPEEKKKFNRLDFIDRNFFHKNTLGGNFLSFCLRVVNALPAGNALIRKFEHTVKEPVLGCEMCGFCRIPYLFYVCPETCPKGLANGPCAGTDENTCEFKDRECIHNQKYRIAKDLGRLSELETVFVPPVMGTRGASSWLNQFDGAIPKVVTYEEPSDKSEVNPWQHDNTQKVKSKVQ